MTPQPPAYIENFPETRIVEGNTNLRVIILEDDPLMRDLLVDAWKQIQEESRPSMAVTEDPKWALAYVLQAPRDTVVVTDIYMPRMSGQEFARQVRDRAPEAPIIYMTVADNVHPTEDGADDLVRKGDPGFVNRLIYLIPILAIQRKLNLTNQRLRERKLTLA